LKLSVVIPAYNERRTILEVVRRVHEIPIDKEIIVVDDGSTDGTPDLVATLPDRSDGPVVRLLVQDRNRGKGAALRRGFAAARGEIVIVQDADLELDPREYPRLLDPIERGVADVVYGSRFQSGRGPGATRLYYAGNRSLTLLSNVLTGLRLTDVWTGYKAFRREVLPTLTLREDRFGFEPEFTAEVARARWRVAEVAVGYTPRTHRAGKKITFRDALAGGISTLRCSLRRVGPSGASGPRPPSARSRGGGAG
jgi:glycosyltransferase involved in cell wall biosynthesis